MALTISPAAARPRDGAADEQALLVPARWLPLARLLWLALVLLIGGLLVAGLPGHVAALQAPCVGPDCREVAWFLTPVGVAQLRAWGIGPGTFAATIVAVELISSIGYIAASGLIIWRRAEEWMALFTAFFLLLFGLMLQGAIVSGVAASNPAWAVVSRALTACSTITLGIFLYFFPDTRLRPRWLWLAVGGWCLAWVPGDLLPNSPLGVSHWPPLLEPALLLGFFALALAAQIWRYRRILGARQQRQSKWVISGLALLLVCHLLLYPGAALAFAIDEGTLGQVAIRAAIFLLYLLIPLSVTVAILRENLWDIDLVINRTLVYGGLTAIIVALYTLVVGGVGTLLRGAGSQFLPFVATALIAVLFQPLRAGLQRRANRLLWGDRDEPYAALARLGQRLEGTLTPEAILPTILQTIREALRLPYAAIALADAPGTGVASEAGTPAPTPLRLPLVYGQETIGELRLAARAPGEAFSAADRHLLADLARQAGVAVHATRLGAEALRLNRELQGSRERLVAAREEERRRLRRDLHDGLGPQLAGFTLRLDVAKDLVRRDPAAAEKILADLSARTQTVMADIRRLVYALRPPALDELGLVGALRQHAEGYDRGDLAITIEAPEPCPPLPAAVEVAAFRIAQEALTNVVRHAGARACTIRLAVDDGGAPRGEAALTLSVADDGRGLPPGYRLGVGLTSMRERAAELGGTWAVESRERAGTTIRARLPLTVSGAGEG